MMEATAAGSGATWMLPALIAFWLGQVRASGLDSAVGQARSRLDLASIADAVDILADEAPALGGKSTTSSE